MAVKDLRWGFSRLFFSHGGGWQPIRPRLIGKVQIEFCIQLDLAISLIA